MGNSLSRKESSGVISAQWVKLVLAFSVTACSEQKKEAQSETQYKQDSGKAGLRALQPTENLTDLSTGLEGTPVTPGLWS